MSNSTFPNPAEVCRERGWKVGDKIRGKGEYATTVRITYVGSDYIHGEANGRPETFKSEWNITAWTEVKPVPVVTVHKASSIADHDVDDGNGCRFFATVFHKAIEAYGTEACERITLAMAEAGKAAIEAELGQGKDGNKPAGKWTADSTDNQNLPNDYTIRCDGVDIATLTTDMVAPPGFTRESLNTAMSRFVAAGLAALNGDAEPVAEGPYSLHVEEADSDDPDDCLASFEIHGKPIGDQAHCCILEDSGGDPIPGLTVTESNALVGKHLGNLVAELNALHAKSK